MDSSSAIALQIVTAGNEGIAVMGSSLQTTARHLSPINAFNQCFVYIHSRVVFDIISLSGGISHNQCLVS